MRLNTIKPAKGSKFAPLRVGRGIGSGVGKTCGRGHKGQKARAGGFHRVGFEGGQMPMARRLPKFGFNSRKFLVAAEIRLDELNAVEAAVIDLQALKDADVISHHVLRAKIILSGKVSKAVHIKGLPITKGARAAIEAAGGKIE